MSAPHLAANPQLLVHVSDLRHDSASHMRVVTMVPPYWLRRVAVNRMLCRVCLRRANSAQSSPRDLVSDHQFTWAVLVAKHYSANTAPSSNKPRNHSANLGKQIPSLLYIVWGKGGGRCSSTFRNLSHAEEPDTFIASQSIRTQSRRPFLALGIIFTFLIVIDSHSVLT
jgi:hypothetical protein